MQCGFVQITTLEIGQDSRSTITGQGYEKDVLGQAPRRKICDYVSRWMV